MLSTKRYSAVVSSLSALLLCVAAVPALAADRAAKIDPKGCDAPEYPPRWQTDGEGGNVVVAFLVGADGKVMESKIVESSGSPRVDRASARAGARCTFQPGARNGEAAPSWTKVRYTWVLN
jgi:protein TonB